MCTMAPSEPSARDHPMPAGTCRLGADAGHALRTPVAALRVELEEARLHRDQVDLEALLARTIDAVTRLERVIEQLRLLAEPSSGVVHCCGFGERLRGSHPR